jgi:A/G-specific adenine glycosylase
VLSAWQGLGYYSRARRLRQGAQRIVEQHGGRVPSTAAQLVTLPGVGQYTAGAIASIAFGERAPVVDGNVVRVLCRLFALEGNPAKAPLKQQLWDLAGAFLVSDRPGDVNQALMELGATVCRPRDPRCAQCPLQRECKARRRGAALDYPQLPKPPTPTSVVMAAAALQRRGRWLLVQLPPDAPRWAGMWQFPNATLRAQEDPEACALRAVLDTAGISAESEGQLCRVQHSVTRFRITLHVYSC